MYWYENDEALKNKTFPHPWNPEGIKVEEMTQLMLDDAMMMLCNYEEGTHENIEKWKEVIKEEILKRRAEDRAWNWKVYWCNEHGVPANKYWWKKAERAYFKDVLNLKRGDKVWKWKAKWCEKQGVPINEYWWKKAEKAYWEEMLDK